MKRFINFSAVYGILLRNLFVWRKDLDRIVDSFWWPFLDLVFWGLTSTYLQQINPGVPEIVTLFLGGIIFWYMVIQAQRDINIPLLDEAWNRNLVNIFTTPLRLRDFLVATLLLGGIKLSITIITLAGISYLLYHFNIFMFGWYLIPSVVNMILTGWWLGFLINGLILRFGYRVQAFAWALTYVLYPFSGVLYPVSVLPWWGQSVAKIVPTSYVFETMRSVIRTGEFSLPQILMAFLLNGIFLCASILFLAHMYKDALKNARLVKLN